MHVNVEDIWLEMITVTQQDVCHNKCVYAIAVLRHNFLKYYEDIMVQHNVLFVV